MVTAIFFFFFLDGRENFDNNNVPEDATVDWKNGYGEEMYFVKYPELHDTFLALPFSPCITDLLFLQNLMSSGVGGCPMCFFLKKKKKEKKSQQERKRKRGGKDYRRKAVLFVHEYCS